MEPRFIRIRRLGYPLEKCKPIYIPKVMTGSVDPKVRAIPSWQNDSVTDETAGDLGAHTPTQTSSVTPEASLLEKAAKFLRDDDIRNAPVERKRTFLQSKGLSVKQVEKLLAPPIDLDYRESQDTCEGAEGKQTKTLGTGPSKDTNSSSSKVNEAAMSKDPPPIITYPEFLLHSQKPPPLVTAQRLLTAGYIISGVAATAYGTSKYLVEPMLESLNSARRSLYEVASTNVDTLNEKLEKNVSTIPLYFVQGADNDDSDIESSTSSSNAARFFSRTVATQTSPRQSRSPSVSSIQSPVSTTPIALQTSLLAGLRDTLEKIKANDTSEQAVQESVAEFRNYLDKLQYSAQPNFSKAWKDPSSDDSVAKVRADIRSVKGVLLSARNFPSSSAR